MDPQRRIAPVYRQPLARRQRRERATQQQVRAAVQAQVTEVHRRVIGHGEYSDAVIAPAAS
jgi:hypothetical protein